MIEVCEGPACRLRAGDLGLGAVGRPVGCLGRCDVPVAAVDGERALTIVARGRIEPYLPPPLPPQPFLPILLRDAKTGANAFAACVLRRQDVEVGGEGEHATRLCAVSGDVLRPGVYELLLAATVADAVAAAGGAVDGIHVSVVGGYLADGEWATDLLRAVPVALVVLNQRRDRHLLHSAADA